ncbi:hypothetical protein HMPREF1870_01013 [Bacteroidales bacterium KA00344]|nr:hypothetical protein HMPREF1870_01013 [Bacteroidales bacterium KA00344]
MQPVSVHNLLICIKKIPVFQLYRHQKVVATKYLPYICNIKRLIDCLG